MSGLRSETDQLMCKCGKELASLEEHACPFASDVRNDEKFRCRCCDDCQLECLHDI